MSEIDLVTWCAMKFVLNVGPWGIASMLAAWSVGCGYAGYLVGGSGRKDRPMGHAKLDHIKYDILPDGSLGPGDNRNLEGPE